jgi:hypothetical protein
MSDPKVIALRHFAQRVAKTYTVNKGDLVWYGKYKNQRGEVKNFGMSDKGDPTITVEQLPSPSARKPKKKGPKTLNLFKIRPRKEDEHDKARKEAVSKALSKREVPKADGSGTTTIYEYGPRQVAQRNKSKAVRIEALRQKMGDLRKHIHADLTAEDPDTRLTALAVSLIDETYARVGNEKSAKAGHHGVTNWLTDHVTLADKSATIRYTGKSGVEQAKRITNTRVLAALRKALKGKSKGDKVLCDGDECSILAKDVNAYLKPFEITAKDIRGLHANEEMKHHLKEQRKAGPELPHARKDKDKILKAEFKAALDLASAAVGHKDSTLRSQYLVPSMEASYTHDGTVLDRLDKKATLSDSEKEDRESARLVRQSPKFKPPRKDKERGRVKDTDPDTDPDEAQDQKDRSNNYKDAAARVGLRYLLAAATATKPAPQKREDRTVGDTWKGGDGKWSAKGKDKIQSGFSSEQAAKTWLEGGNEPGADADAAPEAGSPTEDPKPSAKKPPSGDELVALADELAGHLANQASEVLHKLNSDTLAAVLALLPDPVASVVDAVMGAESIEELEQQTRFAESVLRRIPREKPPTDKEVTEARKLLRKYKDMDIGLNSGQKKELRSAESTIKSLTRNYENDRDFGEKPLTDKEKETLSKAQAQKKTLDGLNTLPRDEREALRDAQDTIRNLSDEDAPTPKEIADALVAVRAAEVRKDPLLLDPSDPLTSKSTEPLNLEGQAQREFMDKMGDLTVDATSEYREMPKGDREAHRKGLGKHLEKLEKDGQTDTEQYHSTLAQVRGLQMATALEDGEDAVGINAPFQTFLQAAESQSQEILDKFIKLNVTGASEGDVDAQQQFRDVLSAVDPFDLKEMVPKDHPARATIDNMTGGHLEGKEREVWMKHMDDESIQMLQRHAEDMIMDDIMFTDMDMVRDGKTTGEQKANPSPMTKAKRKERKKKTKSLLALLKEKVTEAILDGTSGTSGKALSRPTPKKADTDPLCMYDFDPWGTLLPL